MVDSFHFFVVVVVVVVVAIIVAASVTVAAAAGTAFLFKCTSINRLHIFTGIREGRCPPIKKRDDCPTFVWDDCTCDLDCPGNSKCCLDGCRHVCLEPGRNW